MFFVTLHIPPWMPTSGANKRTRRRWDTRFKSCGYLFVMLAGAAGAGRCLDRDNLRLHIPLIAIDDVAILVFVVVAHPGHGVAQALLVAALRHVVEKVVSSH